MGNDQYIPTGLERMIEVGELIPSLAAVMQAKLEKAIEKNKHRREPYYILYTASWFRNDTELRQVFSPRAKKPPKMLNTICWRINNISGEIKQLWCLPLDAPIQPIPEADVCESILEDSKDMPLLH